MRISLLVLHIICAILFGAASIINTNIVTSIIYMIASVAWGVNVGMDIALLHYESEDTE
jgi:hypothetical protein